MQSPESLFKSATKLSEFLLRPRIFSRIPLCEKVRNSIDEIDASVSDPNDRVAMLKKLVLIVTNCHQSLSNAQGEAIFEYDTSEVPQNYYWSTTGSIVLPILVTVDSQITKKPAIIKIVVIRNEHLNRSSFGARYMDFGMTGFINEAKFLQRVNKVLDNFKRKNGEDPPLQVCRIVDFGTVPFYDNLSLGMFMVSRLLGKPLYLYLEDLLQLRSRTQRLEQVYECVINLDAAIKFMYTNMKLLHCDLHNSNILVRQRKNGNLDIQIIDFGRSFFYDPRKRIEEGVRKVTSTSNVMKVVLFMLLHRDYCTLFLPINVPNVYPSQSYQNEIPDESLKTMNLFFQLQYVLFKNNHYFDEEIELFREMSDTFHTGLREFAQQNTSHTERVNMLISTYVACSELIPFFYEHIDSYDRYQRDVMNRVKNFTNNAFVIATNIEDYERCIDEYEDYSRKRMNY